jgi:predicted exporter/SAM-dependent methyltransferase
MKSQRIHLPFLLLAVAAIICLAAAGITRLDIDTDVSKSLPAHEKVIADALEIFKSHPIHDQVAIDIMIDREAPDTLVNCASFLEDTMRASGLFEEIGMGEMTGVIPEIARQVVSRLPLLFSQDELEQNVAPLLQPEAVRQRLQTSIAQMTGLEGIGQSFFLPLDPLGLKDLVLARMINLAPSNNAGIYKGHLISKDGRHLLLVARPAKAGSNTAAAMQMVELFNTAGRELNQRLAASGIHAVLTPTGTFQAALDNERMIRHDVNLALGLSTAGIALLLILAFPRPAFGLLSLIPPLAGSAAALFIYSLFHASISIMVLGFSGALISIMDDFSITYLLFLDRPQVIKGKQAAREVQSIGGLIALLTTIASFLVLSRSDFPIFAQLGEFTALGLAFTYLFIYFICPKVFPEMPPAARRNPPLHAFSRRLFNAGKPGLVAALLLACFMVFFARPHFHLSLSDMNSVSRKTQEDNRMFTEVWGDIGQKIYLMSTAASKGELQESNDRLLEKMDGELRAGRIQSVFNPSMLFPGRELAEKNRAAWNHFWTVEKREQLRRDLLETGTELGLKTDAFDGFLALLAPGAAIEPLPLAAGYDKLLNISSRPDGKIVQFITVTPGTNYKAPRFMEEFGRSCKIFDSAYFGERLSRILFSTFTTSLAVMTAMVALMLLLYFLNWRLALLSLLPLVFAFICTLGTLNLLGHPLDIPGLMLTVVILGVGVDYTIYTVCGRQRYGARTHTSNILVYSAILMSAASTLIGFGVLCFAEHATLRSLGITSLCGIGYSFLGTALLLPPLLEAYFRPRPLKPGGTSDERILSRYRLTEAYPRLFTRINLGTDPLFRELPQMLGEGRKIANILDIGCGYGLPACWFLERFPEARVVGIDPDPEKVRIARLALDAQGAIAQGAAPELAAAQGRFDLILLLDMLHYLDDAQLEQTLAWTRTLLAVDGLLLIRFAVRPKSRRSFYWFIEDFRTKSVGGSGSYRTPQDLQHKVAACGFSRVEVSATANDELFWATAALEKDCGDQREDA